MYTTTQAQALGTRTAIPLSLARTDVTIDEPGSGPCLSQGAQGSVMRGTWNNQRVAVKKPRITSGADLQRFRRELSFLASLTQHPHVVPLLGARALPPDYHMVLPLGGPSLAQLLHSPSLSSTPGVGTAIASHAHTQQQQQQHTPVHEPLSQWSGVLEAGKALASALACAHAAGIVHRDVKPGNCIMQPDSAVQVSSRATSPSPRRLSGRLWLIDWGIACTCEELQAQSVPELAAHHYKAVGAPSGGFHKRKLAGTLEYLAPEVLMQASHSPSSDVYALGVTLNEMATGMRPYADCIRDDPGYHTVVEMGYGRMELSSAVTAKGLRPKLPEASSCPPGWLELVQACWAPDPAHRPSAQQVEQQLAAIEQGLHSWQATAPQPSQDVCMEDKTAAQPQHQTKTVPVSPTDCAGWSSDSAACPGSVHTLGPTGKGSSKVVVTAGGFDDIGPRETQEDRHVIAVGPPSSVFSSVGPPPHDQLEQNSVQGSGGTAAGVAAQGRPQGEGVQSIHAETQDPLPRPPQHTQQQQQAGVIPGVNHHGTQGQQQQQNGAPTAPAQTQAQSQQQCCAVLGVFDGHRGHQAAHYCATHLQCVLSLCMGAPGTGADDSLAAALRRAFFLLETGYAQSWRNSCPQPILDQLALAHASAAPAAPRTVPGIAYPGCTALAAVVRGNELAVANAGDGGCMLCRGGKAVMLSQPHTTALASERARVQAAGGPGAMAWHEKGGGHWRLTGSGLQVTRSIGDFDVKAATSQGVTAEPEILQTTIQEDDEFLVMGTDGLWDTLQPQDVVRMVKDTVKHPVMCAKRLAAEALQNGSRDNVTALVVFLHPVSTLERVFG